MHCITVRRQQANAERSSNDFVVIGESPKSLDAHLRDILRTAQAERGKGVWSDADPEVWIGSAFIGQLERDGDPVRLVHLATERLSP